MQNLWNAAGVDGIQRVYKLQAGCLSVLAIKIISQAKKARSPTMKRKTAKEAEYRAAFKHARKRIEKDGLADYTCVIDAVMTDFKAGVAWARRQRKKGKKTPK